MKPSVTLATTVLIAGLLAACGRDTWEYGGQPVNLDTCLGVPVTDTRPIASADILQAQWPWTLPTDEATDAAADAPDAAAAAPAAPVRLHAGAFTRTSPPEARMTVKVLGCQWADLDGDGADEAAVLVSENFGGTGTFVSLHVLDTLNGEMFGLAPVALGDRVFPYDFAVVGQVIRVGMLSHTADDPLCCPTQEQTRRFRVRNFQLIMVD